jgi:hypothetical protein
MGQGSFSIVEWNAIAKNDSKFQETFVKCENELISLCDRAWAPKKLGYLSPSNQEYGRTTILPRLFTNAAALAGLTTWRQAFTAAGNQVLLQGVGTGSILPEDFKLGWLGLALPNTTQQISEIIWQIGDQRFGRIDLEEIKAYKYPAIIFDDPFTIDEETSVVISGFVEGPIPELGAGSQTNRHYQRIVPLGSCYYKSVDRVLGNTGAVIPII